MINPIDVGLAIAELRKKAGYTQKSLAEILNVTDKAVSKWERGLACPDISLLPKLSVILDADIDSLLSGVLPIQLITWKGIIVLDKEFFPLNTLIFDKPIAFYLISYFMLVGIKEILFIGTKSSISKMKSLFQNGKVFGITLRYSERKENLFDSLENADGFVQNSNILLCNDEVFCFSAYLSRQFYNIMSDCKGSAHLKTSNAMNTPFYFIKNKDWKQAVENKKDINDIDDFFSITIERHMSRGYINIPLHNYENISDASTFVKLFQQYHNQQIADLNEISKNRNFR